MRKDRAVGNAPGQLQRLGFQRVCIVQRVPDPPGRALFSAHHPPGVQQFRGPALADDARQHGAGAHVAASQSNTSEQKCAFRVRRGQPQVRCHGDNRPGPDGNPLDRRNDRLAAADHRLDQVAGHPGEGQKILHVHADQRADDVMHIPA